jgi:response regulator RpfG family c-di-GMP phosphodiesterase
MLQLELASIHGGEQRNNLLHDAVSGSMKRYGARAIEICMIGGTESDALVAKEMLAASKVLNNLHILSSCERALDYLRRDGDYVKTDPVDLILLDVEMPDDAGYGLLETIKRDPQLRSIALAALVSAMDGDAITRAREMHAEYLIEKPLDWEELYNVVRSVSEWWLCVVDIGQQANIVSG